MIMSNSWHIFKSCFKFKSTLFKSLSKELQAFKMVLWRKWLRNVTLTYLLLIYEQKCANNIFRLILIILDILTYWNALEKTNKSGYFHCHTLSYWIYYRESFSSLSLSHSDSNSNSLTLSILSLTQRNKPICFVKDVYSCFGG